MTKRYLGNQNTNEFHDTQQSTTNCQLDEIRQRIYFDSAEQARRSGYDPCAYCKPR